MNRILSLSGVWRFIIIGCVLLLSSCSSIRHSNSYPQNVRDFSRAEVNYAKVQKGQIEYYKFGRGTPIVLIPGYTTDVSSWDTRFLTDLARHHEVIVFNNRNVGKSTIHSPHYESQDLADDTSQLIDDLKLKKPAVLGISMGGMIAQQVAVRHPNEVGELILINTAIAGKQAIHPSPAVEKEMMNLSDNKLARYVSAVQLFFPASWRMQMAYDLVAYRFTPNDYQEVSTEVVKPQQLKLVMDWVNDDKTAVKIHQLKCKVLVLNGEADTIIPPVNSEILAHTIPHAELVRWKEGGHAMIFQFPDQLATAIDEFIANAA